MKIDEALNQGKKIVASLSGGKDSTAMGLMMLERGIPVEEFLFVDTGLEYPEIYATIARFEEVTGRTVTRLKRQDGRDFLYYAAERPVKFRNPEITTRKDGTPRRTTGYGWPNALRRYCTTHLKVDVLSEYKAAKYQPGTIVDAVGIAADEPKRLHDDAPTVYPLNEWGITEADAMEYCRNRGFYPSPCAYDDCKRVSCFCCPLQSLQSIRYLIGKRPELWQRIKELEAEIGDPWKDKGTAYYEARYQADGLKPHTGKKGA